MYLHDFIDVFDTTKINTLNRERQISFAIGWFGFSFRLRNHHCSRKFSATLGSYNDRIYCFYRRSITFDPRAEMF